MDQQFDAAGDAWLASDQTLAFGGNEHLIDRRWGDTEEALQVGVCRRSAQHQGVGVDEGKILPLLRREAR